MLPGYEERGFGVPLLGLVGRVQLAKLEKPKWEQSREEQSKRRGFRDGSVATVASASNRSGWDSAPADHYRAAATRCDRKAAAQTVGATAGAGRAGAGDGAGAGKGHVTS